MHVKVNPAKTETQVIGIEPQTVTITLSYKDAMILSYLTGANLAIPELVSKHTLISDSNVYSMVKSFLDNLRKEIDRAGLPSGYQAQI